jgi:hypothetical protein
VAQAAEAFGSDGLASLCLDADVDAVGFMITKTFFLVQIIHPISTRNLRDKKISSRKRQ